MDFSRHSLRRVPVRLAILGLDLQRAEPAAQKRSRIAAHKHIQHIGAGGFMLPPLESGCIDGDRGCYEHAMMPVDLLLRTPWDPRLEVLEKAYSSIGPGGAC
jgi:hypothetical protein